MSEDTPGICDRCAQRWLLSELKMQWNGLKCCPKCFETRNRQEFVRGRADRQFVPGMQPEPPDNFELTDLILREDGGLFLLETDDPTDALDRGFLALEP